MLELKHIYYTVDDKEILKDINLIIKDRFIVITGPNGSGKSTLVKLIMGIEKPTSGQIIFDGKDITDMSISERAELGISYAFQQPVRFKGLRVRDLLEIANEENRNTKHAFETLATVGLDGEEYLNRELNDTLSGGEIKRLEIAMAASRGTKLSLFDEPEAGIDLWSFKSLIQIFEDLYKKTSGSIVIISHQERILSIADKIVYLKDGQIQQYAKGSEVLAQLNNGEEVSCQL